MSKSWHLVARLGGAGARYPHILVDPHGWCLRMGTYTRQEEKYYSSFPSLLEGLIEHFVRRRLRTTAPLEGLEDLAAEVKDTLRAALDLCRGAVEGGGLDEHMRRSGERNRPSPTLEAPRSVPSDLRAIVEETPAPTRRTAG